MLSLDYMAGALDADGSICIRTNGPFRFEVNFRQNSRGKHIVEEFRNSLNLGSVYYTKSTDMYTWEVYRLNEVKEVSEILLPHLKIKHLEAILILEALELWENNKGRVQGAGFLRPLWVKESIIEISSRMNPSQQKETSRRNKEIRNTIET